MAWSVFNDTLALFKQMPQVNPQTQAIVNETLASSLSVSLDERASTIAWGNDVAYKFRNPDVSALTAEELDRVDFWMDETLFPGQVENGHFIVWMRTAALPSFRKLYGKVVIRSDLTLPVFIKVDNRYPVAAFDGRKFVVLSTASWLGGRNMFLGITYLVVAVICFFIGLFFFLKNRQRPRILGDVRYLHSSTRR
eukprot:GHVT01101219.1.p1 GENE.GHVT01101219.1~~GHVT01101219.1.p1  ORF type:complete len:195 (+),score=34.57 GHVT01101219.1:300-884(+)